LKPKPTHLHRRRMSRRLRSPQRQPAEMRGQRAGNGGRLSRSMTASSKNWPACLGQGPRPDQPDPDWTMPMRIVPTEEARAAINYNDSYHPRGSVQLAEGATQADLARTY